MFTRALATILTSILASSAFAGSIPVASHPVRSVIFGASPSEALRAPRLRYRSTAFRAAHASLVADGWQPLANEWGTALYSDVRFLIKDDDLAPGFTKPFMAALESEKLNLMRIFYLSDDEYNRLALMAFGVAAQESQFGSSFKYVVKENVQFGVTLLKRFEAWNEGHTYDAKNSRGPTQIKAVPEKLKKYYRIDEASLKRPRNAAIATLAFLAQTYNEMLVRARDRKRFYFINDQSIFDFTLYGYFGGLRRILRRAQLPQDLDLNVLTDAQLDPIAVPEMNAYVLGVKKTIRWVSVLERSPRLKYDLR